MLFKVVSIQGAGVRVPSFGCGTLLQVTWTDSVGLGFINFMGYTD